MTGRGVSGRSRHLRRHRHRDKGAVSVWMAVFAVGMFVMAGLVVDGGAAIAARARATDLAEQAARAGADALVPASLRAGGPTALRVDEASARAAANRVLTLAGATGSVSVAGLDVTVTARVPRRAVVLSAVGVDDLTGVASATATVLHGTTVEGA